MDAATKAPEVMGTFYPADPASLAAGVDRCIAAAPAWAMRPKAVVAPHAGHVFSGPIAGSAYRLLAPQRSTIRRVVILSPPHRMAVQGLAVHPASHWATPLGVLPVDRAAIAKLLSLPFVAENPAPFTREHGIEVHLPFIQRALGDVAIIPVLVGQATPQQVAQALHLVWGGPETAIIISSDLSHYLGYDEARAKDIGTVAAIERLQREPIGAAEACGRHALYGLLERARALDMRATCLDYRNSGDTHGDKARVVGYASIAFEYAQQARLAEADRKLVFDIAQFMVRFGVEKGRKPSITWRALSPSMKAQRASFVTLTLNGALRGCIGSVSAHRPLHDDIAESAWKAAFGDPRFKPLTAEELPAVKVDISILSQARPIPVQSEAELIAALDPDRDGLILRDGRHQALFLPHVWGGIPDPRVFVRALKRKAGLAPEHWSAETRAFRFSVESFGQSDTPDHPYLP
jgi:AmmeMemoRadiSam system protein B/AmmeMemoRadiSam system protein A